MNKTDQIKFLEQLKSSIEKVKNQQIELQKLFLEKYNFDINDPQFIFFKVDKDVLDKLKKDGLDSTFQQEMNQYVRYVFSDWLDDKNKIKTKIQSIGFLEDRKTIGMVILNGKKYE